MDYYPAASAGPSPGVYIMNGILFGALLLLMINNRNNINLLKSDMNKYIEKDLTNLKKVLEVTMENDNRLEKKTDFILNVLEEEDQINYNANDYELSKIDAEINVPQNAKSWLDNIVTNNQFKKLL
jgi:hypothetical protein